MDSEEEKPRVPATAIAEADAVDVLEYLLPSDRVLSEIDKGDKRPAKDGEIHLFNENKEMEGTLAVQVKKLHPQNADLPKKRFKVRNLNHYLNDFSPFLLIVVDIESETAYWEYVDDAYVDSLGLEAGQKTKVVEFSEDKTVDGEDCIEDWKSIIDERRAKLFEREKSALKLSLDTEPELSGDKTEYTKERRKVRFKAFSELVKRVYENTCAVCGSQRESPDGHPEVDAAHICPPPEGGSDDIRNGIALCKLHHWAFDSGWLSLTDDHRILTADASSKGGYSEFSRLEGRAINLPANDEVKPHPAFLERHREIHGFDARSEA